MSPPSDSLPSPLRYPGGKSRVARRLCRYIPPHRDYREPFVGGGAIFFRKPKARRSWLNDLHPGLYALWRTLRDQFDDFADLCRAQNADDLEATFQYWIDRRDLMTARGNDHLLERAVQFYFINRTVWSGRVVYDPARRSRLYFSNPRGWANLEKKLEHLRRCSRKLQRARITCLPFEKCLARATPETFVYADPPYYRDSLDTPTSKLYEGHFAIEQHHLLRDLLAQSPAQAMVSYDDRPEVRKLYPRDDGWRVVQLSWTYCGRYAKTRAQRARNEKERKVAGSELLILNYPPPRPRDRA
ncbi:MAG: DNA adenine methylase [Candidatus Brocadiia bacterium]